MENVKLVKYVEWDDSVDLYFKLPKSVVDRIYKETNLPIYVLLGSFDPEDNLYEYSISKVEPFEQFLKKLTGTIETICNQHDEEYLYNHLITRDGKVPAPADVHEMMREEYGLHDINTEEDFDAFEGHLEWYLEWYTAHFFIQLGNTIYDPFPEDYLEDYSEDDGEEDEPQSSCDEKVIPEEVDLDEKEPPRYLYHGTSNKNYSSISINWLIPKSQQHVHLTEDIEAAVEFGERRGTPTVFVIRSGDMYKEGYKFYQAKDGVWLTEHVPFEYMRVKHAKIDFSKINISKIMIVDDARTWNEDDEKPEEE